MGRDIHEDNQGHDLLCRQGQDLFLASELHLSLPAWCQAGSFCASGLGGDGARHQIESLSGSYLLNLIPHVHPIPTLCLSSSKLLTTPCDHTALLP